MTKLEVIRSKTQNSGVLYEVSFIRPILLTLLLLYHSFSYNCGAWSIPMGITTNVVYEWIALASKSILLEGYIFISGYVFASQIVGKRKFSTLKDLAVSKFKRLIIPYIAFGIVYYLLFYNGESMFIIANGIGHLWFLPCLFWCFIGTFLIYKTNIKKSSALLLLGILIPFSIVPIPFQINGALYYLFFFYCGGVLWAYSDKIKHVATLNKALVWFGLFFIVFVINSLIIKKINLISCDDIVLTKALLISCSKVLKAISAIFGIIAIYLTAMWYIKSHSINNWMIKIGNLAFGIYIFHQFILKYLYYKTSTPQLAGSIWLPWIGLAVAVIGSILLVLIFKQTKWGRNIL